MAELFVMCPESGLRAKLTHSTQQITVTKRSVVAGRVINNRTSKKVAPRSS
jgi:hypothetical protein